MMNEIPNFKIGTRLSEVEAFVNQCSTLSESAKNSIFNFIDEEQRIGDNKISNNVELTMIMSYLKDLGKINMPQVRRKDAGLIDEQVTTDDCVQIRYRKELGEYSEETQRYRGETWDTNCYVNDVSNGNYRTHDVLVDNNSDGIADSRELFIDDGENETMLKDENLDGIFETQKTHKKPQLGL